jgi:hypothetical protein
MNYPTTEYVARDEDGNVTSTVNVYRVTEDRAGEFVQTTGGNVETHEGQVLVFGNNPNFCDVISGEDFDNSGYTDSTPTAQQVTATDSAEEPTEEAF